MVSEPAAAERRDVVILVDPLEPRDDDDLAFVEGLDHPIGGDVADAGLGVEAVGHQADLRAGEADRGTPCAWIAIAIRATLICSPVERSMSISRAGGRSVISLASRSARRSCAPGPRRRRGPGAPCWCAPDRPAGGGEDLVRIGDARAAELLDQEGHGRGLRGEWTVTASMIGFEQDFAGDGRGDSGSGRSLPRNMLISSKPRSNAGPPASRAETSS